MTDKYFGDGRIVELTPGIQRQDEKREYGNLNSPDKQLKNAEIWFRSVSK